MHLEPGLPLPMAIHVYQHGLVEAVFVPPMAAKGDVRSDLVQAPQIIGPDAAEHSSAGFAIRSPRQKTDFRVEIVSNLRIGKAVVPLFRTVSAFETEGVVVTVEIRCIGLRDESQIVPVSPMPQRPSNA